MTDHHGIEVSTRRKLEFLRRADSYPRMIGAAVEVIETHFAWIFLTDVHVYKMKKPQRHIWDYQSLSIRERGCRTELRLNRRLAPSIYLEVVPLSCGSNGQLRLGRGGRIVDWLIKMRRLPAERALDASLRTAGRATEREQSGLVGVLSRFYSQATRKSLTPRGYLRSVRARISRNGADLGAPDLRVNPMWLNQIVCAQQRFVSQHEALLSGRASHLVDGHGDLRPEHIFLDSPAGGPCIIDCLEFDARLRHLDPAEELAFLMLECSRLGARELADHLGAGVLARLADPVPRELLHFYMSCQALNRAKVAAWHLRDPRGAHRARHWKSRTTSYLSDADHYARWALQPMSRRLPASGNFKSVVSPAPDAHPAC